MANETKQKAPRRYERMRDSGVEWIGMVPEEWRVIKVKKILIANDGGLWGEDPLGDKNDKVVIRSTEQTIDGKWDIRIPAIRNLNISLREKYRIFPGDLLITKSSGSSAHIGKTTLADSYFESHECYFSNFIQRIRVCIEPKYVWYLFNSDIVRLQFVYLQNSTSGLGNLNSENIRNAYIPLPSKTEQKHISTYLDICCTKIDKIISDAKASIEEYKAWKSSIIYEAVTKGLDPTAEMKDSGVKWIGEMPKAWTLQRAKRHVMIMHGMDPKTEGDIPVYGSGAESFKTCGEYKIGPAVLLGRKGATLNIPHYIEGRYWNVDTAFDAKTDSELNLKYYYYLATCFDYKYYISQTTLPGMTQTSYNNMLIPIPPLQEQRNIVSFVDEKCRKVDDLIVEKKSLISDLESYKKSLIYEVVTGKRRVC